MFTKIIFSYKNFSNNYSDQQKHLYCHLVLIVKHGYMEPENGLRLPLKHAINTSLKAIACESVLSIFMLKF
jgi:hypothetical protein